MSFVILLLAIGAATLYLDHRISQVGAAVAQRNDDLVSALDSRIDDVEVMLKSIGAWAPDDTTHEIFGDDDDFRM